jgi:hypothetical protein
MRPTLGQAATGDNFFNRPGEIRRIWEALEAGEHLLIAAPRRVGKTSLLMRLRDVGKEGFLCIYVIVQSANTQGDFFKRLFRALLDDSRITDSINTTYHAGSTLQNILKKLKGITIAGTGIQFQDAADADYHDEFLRLTRSLPSDMPKIVLLVDEFPDTLLNIEKEQGLPLAITFLQACRELRQDPLIKEKILFVYTGSVGLENVVGRMGVPQHINDLYSIEVRQLTMKEAGDFVAAMDKPFTLDTATTQVLIEKIGWRTLFHFQVALQEMRELWDDEQPEPVDAGFIDRAFDSLIRKRNHFEFWQSRLGTNFEREPCAFATALLSELSLAQEGTLARERINALAEEHNLVEGQRRYVLRTLIHDGYINNNDDPTLYRFNSPLLRLWWQRNVAAF